MLQKRSNKLRKMTNDEKLEALYEKHGKWRQKAIKVNYKIRTLQTSIDCLEFEMGLGKNPFR